MKIECSRCMSGKGHILAFSHVQGGVRFKCGGVGHVELKAAPKPQFLFRCLTMIDGESCFRISMKAPSKKQAMTKLRKFIKKSAAKGIGYDMQNYRVELDASRAA